MQRRILQVPDVLLYGFQTLWNGGGGLVRRHARYWNLWDRASKQFYWGFFFFHSQYALQPSNVGLCLLLFDH